MTYDETLRLYVPLHQHTTASALEIWYTGGMPTYRIYLLQDPDSHEARYVGITRQPLAQRLYQHLREARRQSGDSHRERWLRKVLATNQRPNIALIEETEDPTRERFWILHHRAAGDPLTNCSDGCDGLNRLTEKERAALIESGCYLRHGEEARQKIAEASRRMWADPEKRREIGRKITEATTGRKLSEEHCRKIGDRKRIHGRYAKGVPKPDSKPQSRKKTPEQLERHLEMCRKRSADPEYRRKLSESRKKTLKDPVVAEKVREGCRKRSSRPEYREKLKKAWESRPRATRCNRGHSLEDAYIFANGKRKCKVCCALKYQERKSKAK